MAKKATRIIFIANTRLRYTNILMSMLLSLVEMGYYVKEIDMLQHPEAIVNPHGFQGGQGPVEIDYAYFQSEIEKFAPRVIIFAGGGFTFTEDVCRLLQQRGVALLGVTLSDPDVFGTAKTYAQRFSVHTTNSKAALNAYRGLGFQNTRYLPFAIDSRFFVPSQPAPEYRCDVVVIGHHQPSRLALIEELKKRFDTKIFGSRWPYENAAPVAYPEWLRAVHSGKIVVDFPKTRAGFNNVKIRLFEVAAAGTPLITPYLDEIGEFFEYGREIVGYTNADEMYRKIRYHLDHPNERAKIAENAQLRCAEKHMWKHRFSALFKETGMLPIPPAGF